MNPFVKISKHRAELMGFAAIWVIICHTYIMHFIANPILSFLCGLGYAGVDIFLLVSGFGLYYSSLKPQSKLEFYKKRLFRIYPTYLVIVVINLVLAILLLGISSSLFNEAILQLLLLDFWLTPFAPFWYVPAIVVLYLAFPFYMQLFNKKPYAAFLLAIAISLIFTVYIMLTYDGGGYGYSQKMLFTTRIPVFFLGVVLGKLSQNSSISSWKTNAVAYGLMPLGILPLYFFIDSYAELLLKTGLYWIPIWFFITGLVLFLSTVFSFTVKRIPVINKVLAFLGSISLEIYLSHIVLFGYKHEIMRIFDVNLKTAFLIAIVMSVIFSYLLSKTISVFNKRFIPSIG